ncbi:heterokaryon incompatibility [Rhizodiscina lignyota]|uniref:Heterokaryon incompatibility n=1 Tax=Rhizodiscina lignyota TaxID=1504668 RepID=A0A9P4LZC6_9PEZI|nr:heterokaryon incompatibility [Rhizodiscina lignyota]
MHHRYVALSYVWGDAVHSSKLRASRSNITDLHVLGSLKSEHLPATIEDAITICKRLDQRFLWVDSLCVVQDDAVDQKEQIN